MDEAKSALEYIDEIAPHHERTSCSDTDLYNAAFGIHDHNGQGRCYRCTLLQVAAHSMGRNVDAERYQTLIKHCVTTEARRNEGDKDGKSLVLVMREHAHLVPPHSDGTHHAIDKFIREIKTKE